MLGTIVEEHGFQPCVKITKKTRASAPEILRRWVQNESRIGRRIRELLDACA